MTPVLEEFLNFDYVAMRHFSWTGWKVSWELKNEICRFLTDQIQNRTEDFIVDAILEILDEEKYEAS